MLDGCVPWPAEFADRYRSRGYWAGIALGELPAMWARRFGDCIAVVAGDRRWSYAALEERINRMATGLQRLGIGPGDRVVLQLPNVAEFVEIFFALFKLRAIPVVVLPAYRRSEVTYVCQHTEAVAYIVPDRHAGFDFPTLASEVQSSVPSLKHVIVVGESKGRLSADEVRAEPGEAETRWQVADPGDVAVLHLSGGTTGTPKLIPRTHDDYLYGARAGAELCGFTHSTVYLCSLPVAHQFSLSAPGVLGTFLNGGRVVLSPNSAPDTTFPLIEQERATVAALVPPLVEAWLSAAAQASADLSSLEVLQVGGAKLKPDLAQRVRPGLDARLQQVFGMTEGLLNFTRLDDPDDLLFTTQGQPLSPDDEIRVVDDDDHDVLPGEPGNLLVRGPNTIRGYYRAPNHNKAAFTPEGFYRTGDVVQQIPTGHLVVVGRAKDQINRGGEKIAAEEIEYHLLAHPGVAEAAVVAMPDAFLGERVCAYIVPSDCPAAPGQLVNFVRSRGLAEYKLPDRIESIDALPRTAVGKISKQKLRDRITLALTGYGAN
ncbi:AMP-binding protein [Streptomyces sp. NBC_00289]